MIQAILSFLIDILAPLDDLDKRRITNGGLEYFKRSEKEKPLVLKLNLFFLVSILLSRLICVSVCDMSLVVVIVVGVFQ